MLRHAKLSISIWPLQVGVWPYTSCHAWRLAARTAPWRSRGRLRRRDKPSRHRPAIAPPPSLKRLKKDGTQTIPPPSRKHLETKMERKLPHHRPSNISQRVGTQTVPPPSRHRPATAPPPSLNPHTYAHVYTYIYIYIYIYIEASGLCRRSVSQWQGLG